MCMVSVAAASGSVTTRPTAYCTRLAVTGWQGWPWRFSYSVPATMPASAISAKPRPSQPATCTALPDRMTVPQPARPSSRPAQPRAETRWPASQGESSATRMGFSAMISARPAAVTPYAWARLVPAK